MTPWARQVCVKIGGCCTALTTTGYQTDPEFRSMQRRMAVRPGTAAMAASITRLGISAAYAKCPRAVRFLPRRCNMFVDFRSGPLLLTYIHRQPQGRQLVDRALN